MFHSLAKENITKKYKPKVVHFFSDFEEILVFLFENGADFPQHM